MVAMLKTTCVILLTFISGRLRRHCGENIGSTIQTSYAAGRSVSAVEMPPLHGPQSDSIEEIQTSQAISVK